LFTTLDEEQRVRLKLLSPLGVARRLAERYLLAVEDRLAALRDDVAAIDNIERQLDLFRRDLTEDFQRHRAEVANILNEFELRGIRFFDRDHPRQQPVQPGAPSARDQRGVCARHRRRRAAADRSAFTGADRLDGGKESAHVAGSDGLSAAGTGGATAQRIDRRDWRNIRVQSIEPR
jgi:hypothetical protein